MNVNSLFQPSFGGLNVFSFILTGVFVVFCGLVILVVCVSVIPLLLAYFEKNYTSSQAGGGNQVQAPVCDGERDVMIAVAVAYHLYMQVIEEDQKITWKRHGEVESTWHTSKKFQNLQGNSGRMRRL